MRLLRFLFFLFLSLLVLLGIALFCLSIFVKRSATLDPATVAKLERPITREQSEELLKQTYPFLGPPSPAPKPRVVIVGMDGLDFQYLDPLIKEGKLPNFKRVMQEGVSGPLLSIVPPNSAGAWPAMVTGCNPGKTNLLNFRAYAPSLRKIILTDGRFLRRPALWDILGVYGKKSIAINEPMSYPPHKIKGVMVSGLLTPEGKVFTNTETLTPVLNDIGYKREAVPRGEGFFAPQSTLLKDLLLTERKRLELALLLMERSDWDLLFCMFSSTDRMMHYIGRYFTLGDLEENLLEMDHVLGSFLERLPQDTTLFVVSDHGFDFYEGHFSVPRWLEQEGYWKLPQKEPPKPTAAFRVMRLMKKIKEKTNLPNIPGIKWPRSLQRDDIQPPLDWERSVAISVEVGGNWGSIQILREGQEKESLKKEIAEKLSLLVDPHTQKKAVKQIIRGEDVFMGPYQPLMPDLVFELSKRRASFAFYEQPFREVPVYHHRREGVFLAWGRGIQKGVSLSSAHVADMTPTVLYLLDLPISEAFDGEVLEAILLPSYASSQAPKRISDFPPIEIEWVASPDSKEVGPAQDVEETLRSLGYLQ